MPTRQQVLSVLDTGSDFREAADRLGIPSGQVYMIATGLPADGSDVLSEEELAGRERVMHGGSQALANPPTEVPTRDQRVERWIHERALNDDPMQQAAAERTAEPPEADNQDSEDIIVILRTDVNQTKFIQEQLEATPGVRQGGEAVHQQQRVSLVDMLRVRLSQHELAEEEYFWPAVRRHLQGGDELADRALEQEQRGKDLLQALDGMGGGEDEFDELVQSEHDRAWELLGGLTGGAADDPPAPRERKRLAHDLVSLLSGHELSGELVVWPAVQRFCPDGAELVAVGLEQEHDLKLALNELSSISPSEEFDECVHTVAGELRTHLSYEQSQVWPRLDDALSDQQASDLAARWNTARAASATKPHPHLPADPRLLGLAMPVLALADRCVNLVRGRISLPGA